MTAVVEDLSLDWVIYSAGSGDDGCHGLPVPCGLEAVVRTWWRRTCKHGTDTYLYCAGHRDELIRGGTRWLCKDCEAPATLLRMEPIR
ncbi:MAG TPA: hypothetical protein VFQ44_02385 [Streptosporangiaceae bacterium]|nr:hypothetical protein [Streptosporangiaceae bacterium]